MKDFIIKTILPAACAMALLSLNGCEKQAGVPENRETAIDISVRMPQTKSDENPGDGSYINRCVMQAFVVGEDGSLIGSCEKETVPVTDNAAHFRQIRFIEGQIYRIFFWADHTEDGQALTDNIYDTSGLPSVSLADRSGIVINDDRADGFCGKYEFNTASGMPQSIDVTLTRPFGQLNLFATDASDDPGTPAPATTSLSFGAGLPVGIDMNTGELILADAATESSPAAIPVAANDRGLWLAMAYVFAPADEYFTLPEFWISSFDASGNAISGPVYLNDMQVKANAKTNISGALLSGN